MAVISVIIGSVRQGRFSENPARWILDHLKKREGVDARRLDLKDYPMPFFISALYMQRVLNYSAMQVGLAFLPANIIMAVFSLGLSAKLVMRFAIRAPLSLGLLVAAVGLVLFAHAPAGGSFVLDVLLGMVLLGLGAGWPSTRCCWPR